MKKHPILILFFALTTGALACSDDNNASVKPVPDAVGTDTDRPDASSDANGQDANADDARDPQDAEHTEDATGDTGQPDGSDPDAVDPDVVDPDAADPDAVDPDASAQNSLRVEDQVLAAGASNQVVVASVQLSQPGFVVIYEQCKYCLVPGPGEIIGHQYVAAGEHTDVGVTLSRNAHNGEMLYALLHTDENANGVFDVPQEGGPDEPILQANGSPITEEFSVNLPSLVADDLRLTNVSTELAIPEAFSNGPGWVVIRAGACSEAGAMIGYAPVSDGAQDNIKVTLSMRPAMNGETLCAALHVDTDTIGAFEYFPQDPMSTDKDAPVRLADGSPVEGEFAVRLVGDVPAVRITLGVQGAGYRITAIEPAYFHVGALESANPGLSFFMGWRYEIVNSASAAHPLEFVGRNDAVDPAQDVVILSQAVQGSGEADADTRWVEDGDKVRFTPTGDAWAGGATNSYPITEYRSANAPQTMRGDVGLMVF